MANYNVEIQRFNGSSYDIIYPSGDIKLLSLEYVGTGINSTGGVYLPNNTILPLLISVNGRKSDENNTSIVYEIQVAFNPLIYYNSICGFKIQGASGGLSQIVSSSKTKLNILNYGFSLSYTNFNDESYIDKPRINFIDSENFNFGLQVNNNIVSPYEFTPFIGLNTKDAKYYVTILYVNRNMKDILGI